MNKYKQNVCTFFVVLGSGPALLGMPDIETLSVLPINQKTIGRHMVSDDNADKRQLTSNNNADKRQVSSDDNTDKRQRNCKYERAVQREGGKIESHK